MDELLSDLDRGKVIPMGGTKFDFLVLEMKQIAEQILDGTELQSCKCSQHTLKETMFYANKGEIGEKFRGVLNGSDYAIRALAKYIMNQ